MYRIQVQQQPKSPLTERPAEAQSSRDKREEVRKLSVLEYLCQNSPPFCSLSGDIWAISSMPQNQ